VSDDCPAPAEIWDLASGELDADRARAVALHVAGCRSCREAAALAREVIPPRSSSFPTAWWTAAAAAVAAVALGAWFLREPEPAVAPVFRLDAAPTIESLGAPGDPVLRWTPIEGATYEVTLARADLTVLEVRGGLAVPELAVAPGILAPGETLLWQVVARTADGRTIRSRTFRVARE
jgi:anti-sigma factor ChrR (cupin superfamily)